MKSFFYTIILFFVSMLSFSQTASKNYIKTKKYTSPVYYFDSHTVAPDSIKFLSTIQYFDGLGRPIQVVAHKQSPLEKDIVTHIEYEDFGLQTKEYLPYVSNGLASLNFKDNAAAHQLSYYQNVHAATSDFPYSEKAIEASPLNRVLKQGAPGQDWQLDPNSDADHSIKMQYLSNTDFEVLKFKVVFDNPPSTLEHHLERVGSYQANELYKTVTKDENWQPNQQFSNDHTKIEFKNKKGQLILARTFDRNRALDTYYVYDDYGNLTYVLSPKSIKPIVVSTSDLNTGISLQRPWTDVVEVSRELAENYSRALEDYEDQTLLDADLFNEFGGQGGITLSVINDNLQLDMNILTQEPMRLKNGYITDLSALGRFRDSEVGRIEGADYSYTFTIRSNKLYLEGSGSTSFIVANLNASSRLDYHFNLPWYHFLNISEEERQEYQEAFRDIPEDQKLTTYITNPYGATGGISVVIDSQDNISFSVNISTNTLVQFRNGVALNLEVERALESRNLYMVYGNDLDYTFKLVNNNISISGGGDFTQVVDPQGSGGTIAPPPQQATALTVPQNIIDGLGYIYTYDQRNNMVKKKIPGKDWEHIVYDNLNRPVLTQDPNLRAKGQWLFTKYDINDRPVYTGIYSNSDSRENLQAMLYNYPGNTYALAEKRENNNGFVDGGLNVYYTNNAFPTSDFEVYTVHYFDDYDFDLRGIALDTNTSSTAQKPLGTNLEFNNPNIFTNRTKTLATGSHIRVLETNDWITTVTLYDDKARPLYTHNKNEFLHSEDISNLELDFVGNPTKTHTKHIKFDPFANTTTTNEILDEFEYDHALRLLKHTQQLNNQPKELIVFNKYDELGQLEQKKVGGSDTQDNYAQTDGLQAVDYSYNIRGWLKGINNVDANDPNKLFSFGLNYNDVADPNKALFNGNISESHWRSQNSPTKKRSYGYTYDALNRLVDADYLTPHNIVLDGTTYQEDYFEGGILYDLNGNILKLTRKGLTSDNQIDTIDDLDYDYGSHSNQLMSVGDAADSYGFKDGTNTTDDFVYDDNGNMIKDNNKEITRITYNHLNLPTMVKFKTNSKLVQKHIAYTYDAIGTKLQKELRDDTQGGFTGVDRTYYAGAFTYEKKIADTPQKLKFIAQPEGYIEPNVTSSGVEMSYVYNFTDHLGNIRLSYSDKNNDGQITASTEIIEEKNYYAFGLQHKGYNSVVNGQHYPYGYNGKEENDELGLEWLDFGARNYDASLGRWMNLDPLAELMRRHSPYNYAFDNPVYFIDPDGRAPEGMEDSYGNSLSSASVNYSGGLIAGKDENGKEGALHVDNEANRSALGSNTAQENTQQGGCPPKDPDCNGSKKKKTSLLKSIFDRVFSYTWGDLEYEQETGVIINEEVIDTYSVENSNETDELILKALQGMTVANLTKNIGGPPALKGGVTAFIVSPESSYKVDFNVVKSTIWRGTFTYNLLTGEILSVETFELCIQYQNVAVRIHTYANVFGFSANTSHNLETNNTIRGSVPKVGGSINDIQN